MTRVLPRQPASPPSHGLRVERGRGRSSRPGPQVGLEGLANRGGGSSRCVAIGVSPPREGHRHDATILDQRLSVDAQQGGGFEQWHFSTRARAAPGFQARVVVRDDSRAAWASPCASRCGARKRFQHAILPTGSRRASEPRPGPDGPAGVSAEGRALLPVSGLRSRDASRWTAVEASYEPVPGWATGARGGERRLVPMAPPVRTLGAARGNGRGHYEMVLRIRTRSAAAGEGGAARDRAQLRGKLDGFEEPLAFGRQVSALQRPRTIHEINTSNGAAFKNLWPSGDAGSRRISDDSIGRPGGLLNRPDYLCLTARNTMPPLSSENVRRSAIWSSGSDEASANMSLAFLKFRCQSMNASM